MITDETTIEVGQKVVDDYKSAHAKLYESVKSNEIPDHLPLMKKMNDDLKALGFGNVDEFYISKEQDGR